MRKVGIAPVPSSKSARREMISLVGGGEKTIIDLGSGYGSLAFSLSENQNVNVIGYELSILPYLYSQAKKLILGRDNLTFHRKDFLNENLSGASVLTCFLYAKGMEVLEEKIRKDKLSVTIISNTFPLPSVEPDKVIDIDDVFSKSVYLYKERYYKN